MMGFTTKFKKNPALHQAMPGDVKNRLERFLTTKGRRVARRTGVSGVKISPDNFL